MFLVRKGHMTMTRRYICQHALMTACWHHVPAHLATGSSGGRERRCNAGAARPCVTSALPDCILRELRVWGPFGKLLIRSIITTIAWSMLYFA